jgi:hypothetical protein
MFVEIHPDDLRQLAPRDRGMLSLLADIPFRELDEAAAVQAMIDGRKSLRRYGQDFGFDVAAWHNYFNTTFGFQSTYRREWIAEKLREWVPKVVATDWHQTLRNKAEELWLANPPEPEKPAVDFGSVATATLVQQMINHEGPFDPRNIRRMQDESEA